MAYLTVRDLSLGYDSHEIAGGLNFTVEPGDYLCVVGENGSGKTTLMKTLLHLRAPIGGEIRIGDGLLPLLRKYRGRHYSMHLKENVPSATATLGEKPKDGGRCIPWREVLDYLATEDVGWYVVEAEAIPDSLEPLANSLVFLKPLI